MIVPLPHSMTATFQLPHRRRTSPRRALSHFETVAWVGREGDGRGAKHPARGISRVRGVGKGAITPMSDHMEEE